MLLAEAFIASCIALAIMCCLLWLWTKAFDFMTCHRFGDVFFFATILLIMTMVFYAQGLSK